MGLDAKATQFLLAARARGVSFDRTATIGRQRLYVTSSRLHRELRRSGFDMGRRDAERLLSESDGFAESLFRLLGAGEVVSVDASDYEGASRIVDLNQPLPADLEEAFTAVVDLGTLEHVFDFPAAVRSCMRMVAVDGHFLIVTPANNWAGHGFYQFNPELFHRVLAPRNGFRVERMLVTERSSARWYEVRDPADAGVRGVFRTFRPVDLCVAARRVAAGPVLAERPQQSYYASMWRDGTGEDGLHPVERYAPDAVARTIKSLYYLAQATVLPFDRRSFRRVDVLPREGLGRGPAETRGGRHERGEHR